MPDAGPVLGVDIGGTKILGLAVDPSDGSTSARRQVPTPYDPVELVAAVAGVVRALWDEVGPPAAVGVGVPGLVDRGGVLRYGPNVPGVEHFDLAGPLRARFGVPVAAENDAACAALAEHRLGAARGARHAVVITLGTGIGAGLIVDGRLLRGANGFAGEPGHVLIDPSGPRCACGAVGHWEAVASGTGLANLARSLIRDGGGAALLGRAGGDPGALRGEHVAAAAADGDAEAVEVLERFATWVACGLGGLVAVLDPEVIVLGGGLSAVSDSFLAQVRRALPAATLGWDHRPAVPVLAALLGPDAGAVGAALVAADSVV
jgi:glucokinase